ncbi:MAG: tRNA dihydrouridine synthase DusB [Oscillospiraceae bacterium]|nr:tRNA dihydrouridine synthase DusB [Oscillospiraceae bacterium]
MKFLGYEISSPTVLAPMAGVTDFAYRCICAELGVGVTVTEMVSSRALVYQDKKSRSLLGKNPGSMCGAQIFGNDPSMMAQAAQLALEHSGCDFIDINMGCPMPKIANNGDGSALMRNVPLACQIVKAVKAAVSVPVTVKTRLGWDKSSIHVVEMAKALEDSGADAIAVHGRTKSMLYSGRADWDEIGKVSAAVKIPVIANGDITCAEDAVRCRDHSGASLFMVGRAAFGDPWVFPEIHAALAGLPIPERPELSQRLDVAENQYRLSLEDKGEHIACLEARKHLNWYLRGVPHSNYYKDQISHISSAEEVYSIIKSMKRDLR